MKVLERQRPTITGAHNALLKIIRRAAREPAEFCVAEGPRLVAEALRAGIAVRAILLDERQAREFAATIPDGIAVYGVSHRRFAQVATTETPQGILALVRRPSTTLAQVFAASAPLIVLLDGIQDPGNVGTILRSAMALGATGALLLRGTADPFSPKALRASAGASFRLPILTSMSATEAVLLLRQHSVVLLATVTREGKPLGEIDLRRPIALAVGNEAAGLSREVADAAEEHVRVPIHPVVESLNAAMAAAMALYEAARQRGFRY